MSWLADLHRQISALIDAGGPLMWAILLVSVMLWSLIIERFMYLAIRQPQQVRRFLAAGRHGPSGSPGSRTGFARPCCP